MELTTNGRKKLLIDLDLLNYNIEISMRLINVGANNVNTKRYLRADVEQLLRIIESLDNGGYDND